MLGGADGEASPREAVHAPAPRRRAASRGLGLTRAQTQAQFRQRQKVRLPPQSIMTHVSRVHMHSFSDHVAYWACWQCGVTIEHLDGATVNGRSSVLSPSAAPTSVSACCADEQRLRDDRRSWTRWSGRPRTSPGASSSSGWSDCAPRCAPLSSDAGQTAVLAPFVSYASLRQPGCHTATLLAESLPYLAQTPRNPVSTLELLRRPQAERDTLSERMQLLQQQFHSEGLQQTSSVARQVHDSSSSFVDSDVADRSDQKDSLLLNGLSQHALLSLASMA